MAEVVGLVASILQLVDTVAKARNYLYRRLSQCAQRPEETAPGNTEPSAIHHRATSAAHGQSVSRSDRRGTEVQETTRSVGGDDEAAGKKAGSAQYHSEGLHSINIVAVDKGRGPRRIGHHRAVQEFTWSLAGNGYLGLDSKSDSARSTGL
ncbi:hypothetical protein DFH08DRAFT_342214 [Mycena albidolilacea]|uniref:Uncharacterized protein n=1 Tax=Mycena albidolilacea TaxID=1033008 RepID=A0AAD6ZJM6_9AGAR|nr:hypothetical protein DFH08DRAFT_342214 [Mycena albidolilacea]